MLELMKFGFLFFAGTILGQPIPDETNIIVRVRERFIVKSAELAPMIDSLREHDLLKLNARERRNLCEKTKTQVEGPIFPPAEAAYYALKANMYKFEHLVLTNKNQIEYKEGKEEEALAILCPFVPPFYVSDTGHEDETPEKREHWYIVRAVQPIELKSYRFQVERAHMIAPQTKTGKVEPVNHWFFFLEFEERWRICIDALKLIGNEVSSDKLLTTVGQPFLHTFNYGNREEIYLAYQCATHPDVYLRANHSDTNYLMMISFAHTT